MKKTPATPPRQTGGADRAEEQQLLAAKLVDDGHGEQRSHQVGRADGYRLQIAGDPAEAGRGEDVVQVIEDGVDAGELIEHADGGGEKDRLAVLPGEERLGPAGPLQVDGVDDLFQLSSELGVPIIWSTCPASSMRS